MGKRLYLLHREAAEQKRRWRRELLQEQGGLCAGCQRRLDPNWPPQHRFAATLDHIKPKSRGGRDERDNFQVLCRPCNEEKADTWDEGSPIPSMDGGQ